VNVDRGEMDDEDDEGLGMDVRDEEGLRKGFDVNDDVVVDENLLQKDCWMAVVDVLKADDNARSTEDADD
jgi:hypothetical protein